METELPFEKIKRSILVRTDASTNDSYGYYPESRSVEQLLEFGIVNINKPSGPTSHQISDYVKKILNLSKAGHSGTLDPGVTGCLPVALDKATRVVEVLLSCGKEYVGIMHIHKDVPEEKIRQAASEMVGKITQLPPIRSAVKRQLREREIYYLEILEINKLIFAISINDKL